MKILGLILSTLLLLATPVSAVEYQGKNIDNRMLDAKVYNYATGGVYNVQVRFKQNEATIYFNSGEQLTIRLSQRVITDPNNIQGFGRLGFINAGGIFSFGLYNDDLSNRQPPGSNPLTGFWIISLKQTDVNNSSTRHIHSND